MALFLAVPGAEAGSAQEKPTRAAMPHSRPMPTVGSRCHELRIQDGDLPWRVIYRVDPDPVIICDVFAKKTQATPRSVIESCRRRLTAYNAVASGKR